MVRTGDTGTVGLRIDFSGKEAVDYRYFKSELFCICARGLPFDSYLATIAVRILEGI